MSDHVQRNSTSDRNETKRGGSNKTSIYIDRFCAILRLDSSEVRNLSQKYYRLFTEQNISLFFQNSNINFERYIALCCVYISYYKVDLPMKTSLLRLFFGNDETRVLLSDFFQMINCCYSYVDEEVDENRDDENSQTPSKIMSYELVYWKLLFSIFCERLGPSFEPKEWHFFIAYVCSIQSSLQRDPVDIEIEEGNEVPLKKRKKRHSPPTNNEVDKSKLDQYCTFLYYYDLLMSFLKELPRLKAEQVYSQFIVPPVNLLNKDVDFMRTLFVDLSHSKFIGNISSLTTIKWVMIHSKELIKVANKMPESHPFTVTYFPFVINQYRIFITTRKYHTDEFIEDVLRGITFLLPEERSIVGSLYYETLQRFIETETKRIEALHGRKFDPRKLLGNEVFKKSLLFVTMVVVLFSTGGFGKLKVKNIMKHVLNLKYQDGVKCIEFFVREILEYHPESEELNLESVGEGRGELGEDRRKYSKKRFNLFGNNQVILVSLKRYLKYLEEKFYNYFLFLDEKKPTVLIHKPPPIPPPPSSSSTATTTTTIVPPPPPPPPSTTTTTTTTEDKKKKRVRDICKSPMLLKKCYMLSHQKVQQLVYSLTFGEDRDINRICECIVYVIQYKTEVDISYLDHVMLCATYIILNKFKKKSGITFKDIIVHYTHVQESLNLKTPIELNKILFRVPKYKNVIQYYNKFFIHAIKDFIFLPNQKEADKKKEITRQIETRIAPFSPKKKKRLYNTNLFLSPRTFSIKSPLTPRTKKLFSFGKFLIKKKYDDSPESDQTSSLIPLSSIPPPPPSNTSSPSSLHRNNHHHHSNQGSQDSVTEEEDEDEEEEEEVIGDYNNNNNNNQHHSNQNNNHNNDTSKKKHGHPKKGNRRKLTVDMIADSSEDDEEVEIEEVEIEDGNEVSKRSKKRKREEFGPPRLSRKKKKRKLE